MTQTRRQFLTTGAAIAGAATLGLSRMAHAAEPLGVTLVAPSPLGDVGWTHSLVAGLEKAKAELGSPIKITVLDSIGDGPDADRIFQKTVSDGNKVLIAGSFGYQNAAVQLARRFPDVSVIHASGYHTGPNLSNFAAKNYEGTYLLGMAAAALSKSKKIGAVSAFAIPELITSVNAFALGARAIDPAVEVSVVWVNSWFDPAKEQSAAKALASQGVDVVFSNAQDTPSVVAACEEAGIYVCNLNSSMKAYAPTKYLGVADTDWSPYFKAEIEAHIAGSFKGAGHWLGMKEAVVRLLDLSPDVPADAKARIDEAQAGMTSGSFSPFAGPIRNAAGEEVVAAGAVMPDDQLLAMDYHVEGVVTPLPK